MVAAVVVEVGSGGLGGVTRDRGGGGVRGDGGGVVPSSPSKSPVGPSSSFWMRVLHSLSAVLGCLLFSPAAPPTHPFCQRAVEECESQVEAGWSSVVWGLQSWPLPHVILPG